MPFDISDFTIIPQGGGKYVQSLRLRYSQDGQEKSWEAVKSHDSVSALLYHRDKDAFLLVKQFRPPVYMTSELTCTYELCAGLVDKDVPLDQIIKEEIDEECGYAVPLTALEKISSFYTNVGVTGSRQHLFFAEIDDSMRVHDGGGVNDENIVLEFIPQSAAREFLFNENIAKTPGLMFAFYWFWEKFGATAEQV